MKALTISQPFASMIADGEKWIENRTWGTQYRGPLAIHAGKGTQYLSREELAAYPVGCVVALARLVACCPIVSLRRLAHNCVVRPSGHTVREILANEHAEGPWLWILAGVRKLAVPIVVSGKVGLWDWQPPDAELTTRVEG